MAGVEGEGKGKKQRHAGYTEEYMLDLTAVIHTVYWLLLSFQASRIERETRSDKRAQLLKDLRRDPLDEETKQSDIVGDVQF